MVVAIVLTMPAFAAPQGVASQPGRLVGWGDSYYGETSCPAGNNYVAVEAGEFFSLALRSDGTLVGWGMSDYGVNVHGLTNCPPGSNFVAIAVGADHALALRGNGTLVGWGSNLYGTTNCPPGSNYVAIAASFHHCLALRNDGTLVSWGHNYDGETNCPPGSNYRAIAASSFLSLAVRSDGSLVGWGDGSNGRTNCPAGNNFVAVSAGSFVSLALRSNGSMVGWGNNAYGQVDCPTGNDFAAIFADYDVSLALRCNGSLAGWGSAGDSRLNLPAGSSFVGMAVGSYHCIAVCVDPPFVAITNDAIGVDVAVATCSLGGTNMPSTNALNKVVGTMWWSNTANGAHGSFVAQDSWTIPDIPLGCFGNENTIVVYGSNRYGTLAHDSMVVTRGQAGQVALLTPTNGYVTSSLSQCLQPFYGSGITQQHRYLMTNSTPVFDPAAAFLYTNAVVFSEPGAYYWTALGYDASFVAHYAPQTNRLAIVEPRVRLVAPAGETVLTNVFACALVADYGACNDGRQLSTNNGASWFDFNPLCAVAFPDVGAYAWTARGRFDNLWWYAPATNTLVICTNYTGKALFLVAPPQDGVYATTNIPFSVLSGPGFTYTDIAIDTAAFSLASFPLSLAVAPGIHTWTARGAVLPGPVCIYAPSTNTFTVVNPATSSVTLIAPANGAALEQDYVFFDVLFCSVGGVQLSTNNGADWFAYASPLVPPKGQCQWSARGTNAAGDWVYAPATNTLHLYDPAITITTLPAAVTYDVTTCTIAGTANAYVVGGLQWTNALNAATGQYSILNTQYSLSNIPLAVGPNPITVIGTNAWGVPACDTVTITRGGIGTGMPFIDCDITNEPFIVYNAPTNIVFTGTNNLQVVGDMWIASSATTQTVVFAAAQSWTSLPVNIELYTNIVNVFGTNVFGVATNDVITVIGVPEPAVVGGLAAIALLGIRKKMSKAV